MANKRLYYAIKQVGITPDGSADPPTVVYGAQDISVSTNFNLTQIFELGQLEIYENIEDLPDVEVSISKIFDGKPLIWHLATRGGSTVPTSPTLAGRSNEECVLTMSIFPDDNDAAEGTPDSVMECSGLFPRTLNYNMTADGSPFTESLTFVGNDKIYSTDTIVNTTASGRAAALASSFDGQFSSTTSDTPSGIETSEDLIFTPTTGLGLDINGMVADPNCTILPPDIEGISTSGTNPVVDGDLAAHIQSIAISTDLGREELNQLGKRGPYHRYATFPVEVTCAIEALSSQGDNISAVEEGINSDAVGICANAGSNLKDSTIRLATCGGVRIYLGAKNRLSSVDFGGGTTDGGNDTNTYNFTNFNILTVMAEYDPHPSGSTWWTNRADYLVTTP